MKNVWMVLVQIVAVIHVLVVMMILFGWLWPAISYLYGFTLLATMVSWALLKRCVLLDIENYFQMQYGAPMHTESGSFIVTWLHKWFGDQAPSDRFITLWGGLFLVVSFSVWAFNQLT